MTVKINIVTPTYNQAQFLGQTIESVLSQEGDFYIDYVVINDGSTDNGATEKVIEKYAQLWQSGAVPVKCRGVSFRHWTRPNKGQTPTINEGFRSAKGEILAWMNSDDYYFPGVFEAVTKAFDSNPDVDFFYGDTLKVYEDGSRPATIEPRPRPDENFESLRGYGNSFIFNFFTRRIFDKTGPLDETLKYCVDLDQWFRIFKIGKTKYLPFTLGAFRLWNGSHTMTKQSEFARERTVVAKRYGANIIPPKKIYKWRGKIKLLNLMQGKTPRLYGGLKTLFYKMLNSLRYQAETK